jgi:hypothetical protein
MKIWNVSWSSATFWITSIVPQREISQDEISYQTWVATTARLHAGEPAEFLHGLGRLDQFAEPSANDRYLREPDYWGRAQSGSSYWLINEGGSKIAHPLLPAASLQLDRLRSERGYLRQFPLVAYFAALRMAAQARPVEPNKYGVADYSRQGAS